MDNNGTTQGSDHAEESGTTASSKFASANAEELPKPPEERFGLSKPRRIRIRGKVSRDEGQTK